MADAFKELLATAQDRSLPPVANWHPERVGAIDIRIDRNGNWFHEGNPIKRFAIARVFSTILRKDGDEYYLVTPGEKLRIEVADAPFVATDFEVSGAGDRQRIAFAINVGDVVVASEEHPITVVEHTEEPRPYIHVRDGLDALIHRNAFYRLVDLAQVADDGTVFIDSDGARFVLGRDA